MEPGGGHRSGAGSSGAGSNKCTEVANGKHNTKIDKLLQHELNDATECKNCEQPQQNPSSTSGLGRSDGPSPGSPPAGRAEPQPPLAPADPDNADKDDEDEEEEEEIDVEDSDEGEEEEEEGDGAADTK